jgi:exopolysaccharide biosynthesis polyprenyl glycosylphosphotransferase
MISFNKTVKYKNSSSDDLAEKLYTKYAKGGVRLSYFTAINYFYIKKYSWIFVVRSSYLIKRLLDILVSFILLIVFSPLFLLTWIAIKIDDPGPAFYNQIRVKRWGDHFRMYKFRSMLVDADQMKVNLKEKNESGEVIFKIRKDPRATRVGRVIRKLSIDELPQLWNVLKGDMSLVGPRPPLPSEVDNYDYEYRKRLDVKPGLTCFWQISGRSDINFRGQVKLDLEYIESQSFWTDFKILLRTIPAVIFGKGAY